jgi:hypothetical protein
LLLRVRDKKDRQEGERWRSNPVFEEERRKVGWMACSG